MVDIIYEDKDIVVCIKPVGILSQESGKYILRVINKYANEEYTVEVTDNARPVQLCMSGSDAYLLTETNVRTFSRSGEGVPLSLPDDGVERLLIRQNGKVLACTMSYATVLSEAEE